MARENNEWTAAEISERLQRIANQLAMIRREHQSDIDASIGKRSGWKDEI